MKLIITFLSFNFILSQIQSITLQKVSEQPMVADQWFGVDAFGYQYYAVKNEFIKQKGAEKWVFKQIDLGVISRVDIQNPLRIILFYEPFNKVVTLDNQLNKILSTDFNFYSNILASSVGLAHGDRYWVYNINSQQVGLFSYFNGQYKVFPNYITSPIKTYGSNFNHFFWINEDNEWWQTDIFGKFQKIASNIKGEEVFFLNQNWILVKCQSKYHLLTKQNDNIPLNDLDKNISQLQFNNQILSIFTPSKISQYQLKIN